MISSAGIHLQFSFLEHIHIIRRIFVQHHVFLTQYIIYYLYWTLLFANLLQAVHSFLGTFWEICLALVVLPQCGTKLWYREPS